MVSMLKEVSEPSRRQILSELLSGPKCVNDLVAKTSLKQPNVSNHLAKLRCSGIVCAHKLGRQVYYKITCPEVEHKLKILLERRVLAPRSELDVNLIDRFVRSASENDGPQCLSLLDILIDHGVPTADIYCMLLEPALQRLDELQLSGEIDEADEAIALMNIERLSAHVMHYSSPRLLTSGRVLLGCLPGESRSLRLRMAADVLTVMGWSTVFLGAGVSIEALLNHIKGNSYDWLILGAENSLDISASGDLLMNLSLLNQGRSRFETCFLGTSIQFHPILGTPPEVDAVAPSLKSLVDLATNKQSRF